MTREEMWTRKHRGSSLRMCFKGLLEAVLRTDLGEAQRWHQFIYAAFPKHSIEAEFNRMFKKELM